METRKAPDPDEQRQRAVPLSFYAAALFSVLIVLAGGIIGWFNFAQNAKVVLAASDRVFAELHRDVADDLELGSRRNRSTLAMLSFDPVHAATTLEQRLASLPLFREALDGNERITALYVGYADGDFFQVVPLRTTTQRAFYRAPEHASYLVWSIERALGQAAGRYLFFDRALNSLGARPGEGASYDPRQRRWYQAAMASTGVRVTAPYVFFTTGDVGVTAALHNGAGTGVIAGDATMATLSAVLAERVMTPSAVLAIYGGNGDVIAHSDPEVMILGSTGEAKAGLPTLATLNTPILFKIAQRAGGGNLDVDLDWQGRRWKGVQRELLAHDVGLLYLGMAAPVDELLADAKAIQTRSLLVTGGLVLLVLPLAWLISLLVSTPLRALERQVRGVQEFDFRQLAPTRSPVREVNRLVDAVDAMKRTIRSFLGISADLSAERRFPRLLEHIAQQSMRVAHVEAAVVYLLSDDATHLDPAGLALRSAATIPGTKLLRISIAVDQTAAERSPIADADKTKAFNLPIEEITAHTETDHALKAALGCSLPRATAVPLKTPHGETVGVLCLLGGAASDPPQIALSRERLAFVEALAGVAAVAIDNQRLFKTQKDLLDALIKLLAGAIDAKSPYTGGHCQRVPVITRLLAEAACASDGPPFETFSLSEDDWEAVDVACWLHDCGKVTTPEYVVDKATKLQTIYDRIHEIRMRFEVLKQDAEIAYWQAVIKGGDAEVLRAQLEKAWRELDEDYDFVALCNEGGEFMAPERIARLRRIGERTWLRTLDDRIGTSREERARKAEGPPGRLPVIERLLADKPEHLILRSAGEAIPEGNPWGFRLDVPEHKHNLGELYNLCVVRGTLTAEERFIINNHVIQTIVMLGRLPFPRHLHCVPEFAGGHHEKVNGTGYPRRLTGEQMSWPARMMAIADIFEALTASDRPYKKAKTVSEAIKIMDLMRKDGDIDPDLFELFLASGVYLEYARRFLHPEQIDAVDIAQYLRTPCRPPSVD
jgi:HD-GYP domain-containing protein (c-di-GMP phosphodiesterase class II)